MSDKLNTNNLYNETYQTIFNELCILANIDTLNDFKKQALLFHTVMIKNKNIPLELIDKENFLDSSCVLTYLKPSQITSFKLKNDNDKIILEAIDDKQDKIKMKLSKDHKALKNIDYNNLNSTILSLEDYLKEHFITHIPQQNSNSIPFNTNPQYNQYSNQEYKSDINMNNNYFGGSGNYMSGNINPNKDTNYNPFFNSGGVQGGNLVGPNSDFFKNPDNGKGFSGDQFNPFNPNNPNMFSPNLIGGGGANNPFGIRYDPIGPFGNFGAPDDPDSQMFPNDPHFNGKKMNKFDKKGPFDK